MKLSHTIDNIIIILQGSDFSKKSIINDFNTKINHYKYFNSLKLDNKKKILILKEKLEKLKKINTILKPF